MISDYERGKHRLSKDLVKRFANIYKISMNRIS
ncbi:hypothetical protein MHK_005725 [Candidatus Magnetomorum sp. HK-1]|nr:hypothetical protein MHK_005725 [Candidatus Magnetomorum sp. HK-1]